MTFSRPKKLYALTVLAGLGLVLSVCLAVYFFGKGAFGGVFLPPSYSFSVSVEGETLLTEDSFSLPRAGEQTLALANFEESEATFTLLQGAEELFSLTIGGGEERRYTLSLKEDEPLSLCIASPDKNVAFVCDPSAAATLFETMQGGDLVFLNECDLSDLYLKNSFRLFGKFSFSLLSVESVSEDPIVLLPADLFQGKIFVQAPQSKLYFRTFSPSFEKDEYNFYFQTKSCNGKGLNAKLFPVSDFENLKRLSDENSLPHLSENSEIRFVKTFSVTENLSLTGGVTLDFTVPILFENASLFIHSEKEETFVVKASYGSGILSSDLVFDAPLSSLTWEGLGAIPALSTVSKQSNLKSYNGTDLALGGTGEAKPILLLKAEENPFLEEDVSFTVNGNALEGIFPFATVKSDLKAAVYHLSAENGTARLEGDFSEGTVITTDEKGRERRFCITMKRDGYNIPVVYLETENGAAITSKSQYVNATFSMEDSLGEYPDQKESTIRIRGRGNSSWKWEKKPYKIHFAEPTSLLGLPAAEEWALFSNYADKSLIRNRLAQVMASNLSFDYNPTHVCVDVFLNGEYLGVYTLGEHLEEGEGRVEVEHNSANIDCGYFMEAGGVVSGVDVKGMNYFHAGLVKFVLVKSPEYNTLTSEQFSYIKEYMLAANSAVKKGEGYEEYLDLETLVDWLIMIELSNNTDCAWRRSTYLVKNPGEKITFGPVWDFDLGFGNFSKDNENYDTWVSFSEDDYVGETWSQYLLNDPEFQALFKARWEEVGETLLETAFEEIDRMYEILLPSADENFERWDILGRKVAFEPHDTTYYPTFESQMDYLRTFLGERSRWITEQVENW